MPCYTRLVLLEDNDFNQKARKRLKLPEKGKLSINNARRVRVEAGVMRTQSVMRRINSSAVIRRDGNKLTISVEV